MTNFPSFATLPHIAAALVIFPVAASGTTVLVDDPVVATENQFPFGGPATTEYLGTIYQQAYNRDLFQANSTITSIAFTLGSGTGDLWPGVYTFSLSTAARSVNNLDTTNFDSNLASDTTRFAQLTLGGPAPDFLRIDGVGFDYDPSLGDLLLDIRIAPSVSSPFPDGAFYRGVNNEFGDTSSRAHNFGLGFEGSGLVTGFTTIPEPSTVLLSFLALAGMTVRTRREARSASNTG